MSIGEKIKILRKSNNKSQEDLALDLGVSRQTINKWETNKAQPNTENIKLLCSIFALSADYFLESEVDNVETAVTSSIALPQNKDKRKIFIICAVINGFFLLIGAFFSVAIGFVVFSPNTGDRVVGTNHIESVLFTVVLVLTILFLVVEVLLLIFIFRKRQKTTEIGQL